MSKHLAEQLTLPLDKDRCQICGEKLLLVEALTKEWKGNCSVCHYLEIARRNANMSGTSFRESVIRYIKGICRRTHYFIPAVWKGKRFIDLKEKAN